MEIGCVLTKKRQLGPKGRESLGELVGAKVYLGLSEG